MVHRWSFVGTDEFSGTIEVGNFLTSSVTLNEDSAMWVVV